MEDFFTFCEEDRLVERIGIIDPSLQFIDVLGRGSYGLVAKVAKGRKVYALKMDMCYSMDPRIWELRGYVPTIQQEMKVQRLLSGIKGIPEVHEMHHNSFLMDYIEGKRLDKYNSQPQEFFDKVHGIVIQMNERGVAVQEDILVNVLVDKGSNPWLIDFMLCHVKGSKLGPTDIVDFSRDVLLGLEMKYKRIPR